MATADRVLTDVMVEAIRAITVRYPVKRAAMLPALHLVHERLRHVPLKAVVEIAALLEVSPAEVQDVLTFYGFFQQDGPHGRTRAWVCRSASCALRGGEEVLRHLCELTGIQPGETTPDGKLTLEAAECLGACEHAPCMLAGDVLYTQLDERKSREFLESLE